VVPQIGKFFGSGFLGTICHYAILCLLVTHNLNPLIASSIGMIAGAVIVYVLNYHITFCSSKSHFNVMRRFIPMLGIGFCLNGILLNGSMEYLSFPLTVSQLIATAGQFLFGFFISRIWVF
jgi:putative flippase GtrA